jgi:hypothetical protein
MRGPIGGDGCGDGLRMCGRGGGARGRICRAGRHVGLELGDDRVCGLCVLGGGDGMLVVLVVPRAYGAGRTSWAILCVDARICPVKLKYIEYES